MPWFRIIMLAFIHKQGQIFCHNVVGRICLILPSSNPPQFPEPSLVPITTEWVLSSYPCLGYLQPPRFLQDCPFLTKTSILFPYYIHLIFPARWYTLFTSVSRMIPPDSILQNSPKTQEISQIFKFRPRPTSCTPNQSPVSTWFDSI